MVWYSGFPKNSSLKWFFVLIKKAGLYSCNTWQTSLNHPWLNHSLPPLFHHAIRRATASIRVSECACSAYFAEVNVLKGAWILTQYTFVSVSLFEEYLYYVSNSYNYAPHRAKFPSRYFIETGRNYLLVIISPYLKTEHRSLFCARASCWLLYYVEIWLSC